MADKRLEEEYKEESHRIFLAQRMHNAPNHESVYLGIKLNRLADKLDKMIELIEKKLK